MLGSAWSLRWRSPELAWVLGQGAQAAAVELGDDSAALNAQALVVFASCRLGWQREVTGQAIAALRAAERDLDSVMPNSNADIAVLLRLELAGCARASGLPLVGARFLRQLLACGETKPAIQAAALVQLASCLTSLNRYHEFDNAMEAADQLYTEDQELSADTILMLRTLLRSVVAAEHRRRGDPEAAFSAASEGAELLLRAFTSPEDESGQASARIAHQLVLALLDLGRVDEALAVASGALSRPVRAPAAAAIGWLGVTIALRAHVPLGETNLALAGLRSVVELAHRHRLNTVGAAAYSALAELHENSGELVDAVNCLRGAQAAQQRHTQTLRVARAALQREFGEPRQVEELVDLLASAIPAQGSWRTSPTVGANVTHSRHGKSEKTEPELVPRSRVAEEIVTQVESMDLLTSPGPRHLVDATRDADSVLSNLDIAEGSGGRRRAPEVQEDSAASIEQETESDIVARLSVLDTIPLFAEPGVAPILEMSDSDQPDTPLPISAEFEQKGLSEDDLSTSVGAGLSDTSDVGLGDLLAEALLAYQNTRDAGSPRARHRA